MSQTETRFRPFVTKVEEILQETKDTVTLLLSSGDEPRDYLPGQFLTIDPKQFPLLRQQISYFEHTKKTRELVRAYSLTSTPDDPWLAITIKEELFVPNVTLYPPILSPFLVYGVSKGLSIEVRGFSGAYILPEGVEEKVETIVHLVAGSGVVPNFSILRWSLRHHPRLKHLFVYSNQTSDDIIFRAQLTALENEHPERLRVLHCLTREPSGSVPKLREVHLGRVSKELLASVLPKSGGFLAYLCGPGLTRFDKKAAKARGEEPRPRFLDSLQSWLLELGVTKAQMKTEVYG